MEVTLLAGGLSSCQAMQSHKLWHYLLPFVLVFRNLSHAGSTNTLPHDTLTIHVVIKAQTSPQSSDFSHRFPTLQCVSH